MLRHESPQMTRGITRRVDGAVVSSPDEDPIENLDDIPWPDRSLLDNSMYINPLTGKVFTVIRPSRGCPGRCLFCVGFYYGKTWRTRSVPNIVDELEECVRRYGIADFLLNADLFTQNKAHVIAFCTEILRRRLDVTWVCNSRVDTVDEERLSWMKKAGCQLISLGIESGNDEILANVRKGTRRDTIVRGIEAIRRSGIKSLGYFVFGLPGETTATVEHTIRFALELPLDYAHFMTATPYPGTELARYLAGNNLITSTEWARYDETRCDVYDLPGLTGAQIRKAARRAYLRWYFRPRILFRTMAECVTSVGRRRNLSLLAGLFRQRHGRRPAVHRPM
jgi:radical SAM superfamily enzyme YgiQ (UPF0313 family)